MNNPRQITSAFSRSDDRRGLRWWLVLAAIALVGAFYVWTITPEGKASIAFDQQGHDYYNLLTRGLARGELSLGIPADPALAAMRNPYDPAERGRHGMHDVSYFRGKYHLYFGITPALLLHLPVRLLSGTYVSDPGAIVTFGFVGFVLSVGLLAAVRRCYFLSAGHSTFFMAVFCLGLATMVPVLMRRPSVWQIPIACSYALEAVRKFAV
jgi:hypothetical protein